MKKANSLKNLSLLEFSLPMHGICLICMEMSGNGATIGTAITLLTHKPARSGHQVAPTRYSVVAVGIVRPKIAAQPTVSTINQITDTTA